MSNVVAADVDAECKKRFMDHAQTTIVFDAIEIHKVTLEHLLMEHHGNDVEHLDWQTEVQQRGHHTI